MQVNFDDAGLARRCNRADGHWESAAHDVSLALGLMTACESLEVYLALPTTRLEGETIVFEGTLYDVFVDATVEAGLITVHQIVVTEQM